MLPPPRALSFSPPRGHRARGDDDVRLQFQHKCMDDGTCGTCQFQQTGLYVTLTHRSHLYRQMPTVRGMFDMGSVVQSKLYIVGGRGFDYVTNVLEYFDPSTSAWYSGPSMVRARYHPIRPIWGRAARTARTTASCACAHRRRRICTLFSAVRHFAQLTLVL